MAPKCQLFYYVLVGGKGYMRVIILFYFLSMALLFPSAQAAHLSTSDTAPHGHWSNLARPHYIAPNKGAIYYGFDLPNGSHANLVVVDMRTGNWIIRPALASPTTAPTSTIALRENASAATNGGYFNLKDGGLSASYVVINGTVVADPHDNKLLIENPKLKPHLPQILNRSEVRFLTDKKGKWHIQIVRHDTPVPSDLKLVHSLQAGPQLLPMVDAVDEAFIRINPDGTDMDSINVRKEAARTAFGITNDGYAMMLCVAGHGQNPESSGITLSELASLMRKLGCVQALNLDGGASTTMWVRLSSTGVAPDGSAPGATVCGKNPETLVKSILMLEPAMPGIARHR